MQFSKIHSFIVAGLLLSGFSAFATSADAKPFCPPASEYFDAEIKRTSTNLWASPEYLVLYWQEMGVEAVLSQPTTTRALANLYKTRPLKNEKTAKRIMKYYSRLLDKKKNLKPPTELPMRPSVSQVQRAERKLDCQYDPAGWNSEGAVQDRAKSTAKKDNYEEIRGLLNGGNKLDADKKMREYYPLFMAAHDAAVETEALVCMPAAGVDASQEEVLQQFNLYSIKADYNYLPERHRDTYGHNSDVYKRMNGLKSAYATQLVSRFGVEILAQNSDVFYAFKSCGEYYDKDCWAMRTRSASIEKLAWHFEDLKKDNSARLDRSTIPLLVSHDSGQLEDFPTDDIELWKGSLLGECSNQHLRRGLTASVRPQVQNPLSHSTQPDQSSVKMDVSVCDAVAKLTKEWERNPGQTVSSTGDSYYRSVEPYDIFWANSWIEERKTASAVCYDTYSERLYDRVQKNTTKPSDPADVADPDALGKVFREMSRAMSCTRQERVCDKGSQFERCWTVTVNTC